MKRFLPAFALAAVAGLLLFTADALAGEVRSGLTIKPNSRFVLGDVYDRTFTVEATNKGEVAVRVFAVKTTTLADVEPTSTLVATIEPGRSAKHEFAADETAVLENSADTATTLAVRITGRGVGGSMGMRNEALDDE